MAKGKSTAGGKDTIQKTTGAGAALAARSKDAAKKDSAPAAKKPAAPVKAPSNAEAKARVSKSPAKRTSLAGKALDSVKAAGSSVSAFAGAVIARVTLAKSR